MLGFHENQIPGECAPSGPWGLCLGGDSRTALLGTGGFKCKQTKQEVVTEVTCLCLVVYARHSVCVQCLSFR